MKTTPRLLLPFTEEVDALALSCAMQLAKQREAVLVALALIPVRSDKGPRLESIQAAQDFLVLTQRKAERQGVPIESSQVYTHDTARSIEAFAGEMNCEATLLFLSDTREALLSHAMICELMDRSLCNMQILLLPEKRRHKAFGHKLHLPLPRRSTGNLNREEMPVQAKESSEFYGASSDSTRRG
jgi:hypothetical protein